MTEVRARAEAILDGMTLDEQDAYREMLERKTAARLEDRRTKAIGALRALLSIECVCDPRPIGGGRVYHMQDCLYDRIRDYMNDADIALIIGVL